MAAVLVLSLLPCLSDGTKTVRTKTQDNNLQDKDQDQDRENTVSRLSRVDTVSPESRLPITVMSNEVL